MTKVCRASDLRDGDYTNWKHVLSRGLDPSLRLGTPPCELPYFMWLKDWIQQSLLNIPQGKTLYVLVHSIDRLIRPSAYNSKNPATWDHTEDDFKYFNDWLQKSFGERVKDIVFVTLHSGTPKEIRGTQSKQGMIQKKSMGGRPRKKSVGLISIGNLKKEMISLASSFGNNSTQIYRHLTKKYGELPIKIRAVQGWMKKAKVSGKPGRPYRTIEEKD